MSDDLKRIEDKLDEVIEALPMIYALGSILVRRKTAIAQAGLGRNTLNDKQTYEIQDSKKVFVEVSEIAAIKRPKKTRKRVK